MDQYPAKLSQPHPTAASPPPDCGVNPALHEPLPYPPTSFDPQSFTCITPPYGSRAAPLFAECCDSPVLNFTTVHLTSEGPSSCAAYCNVKPDRLLVSDYQSSDFYTCVFGGPKEDKDVYVQLECWDGEGFVGDLDWADRFAEKDGDSSNLKKRNAQENTDAPASSSVSTTTYDPSFWSSLISAAATETASIVLPTEPMTPVLTTTPTATAANGTAASSSDASLASGTFVSVSEVSGTRTSTGPAETSASATSGAASSGGSSASSSASASAAASSSTSGAGARFEGGYGKWLCTGLLLSVVFASLQ
ncbi:hypothetical protein DIS24_g153 [Lasiodiplodia hormozganensis]|uniref:Uncharacterized protein n=1 Tax=Lasiodiplodia hormozganensis TaxID=869390 RepID=A0AA40D804_9PEZI|nr:hypothetical protein DIS24_g153 [Lasiodiplodia hormozganensis]